MSQSKDISKSIQGQIQVAAEQQKDLSIIGGDSKNFLGRMTQAEPLPVSAHCGIVSYEPTELVITARAGTPMTELEAALKDKSQMFAFEPPHFGANATLGGTIAAGLSGPRRPYAGAARDFVLGVKMINGKGEILSFGGQVMKNVAGYDLSRLMTGAMGTLGVLLEVSLKVLPLAAVSQTRVFEMDEDEAIRELNAWSAKPLPISGGCHVDGKLYVRLSGTASGVRAAANRLGGESQDENDRFWRTVTEHDHAFFRDTRPLWRVSVPPATPAISADGDTFVDWGGALRWVKSDSAHLRERAAAHGGHAMMFRHGDRTGDVYHPLSQPLLAIHRRLKQAFDPSGVLNRARVYESV